MKCPKCGADSSVLDTRPYKGVLQRRRRECFNEHVFPTYEVHSGNLNHKTIAETQRGVAAAAVAHKRKQFVAKNPNLSTREIVAALGIGAPHARRLRRVALGPNGHSMLNETKIP